MMKNYQFLVRVFLMFKSGKDPLDVAILLNLDEDTTKNLYGNFAELCRLDRRLGYFSSHSQVFQSNSLMTFIK